MAARMEFNSQYCSKSVDYYCSEHEVIRVSENNLHEYIDLSKYTLEKRRAGVISNVNF